MKEEKAREFLESKGISPDKIYLREPHFPAVDFVRLLVEYANQQPEQDKVREAAENAFNQARKQTSMLGEKDVQMTDYLISPKYKTFDDYWNSKKH